MPRLSRVLDAIISNITKGMIKLSHNALKIDPLQCRVRDTWHSRMAAYRSTKLFCSSSNLTRSVLSWYRRNLRS
jgi:hypothetical protein